MAVPIPAGLAVCGLVVGLAFALLAGRQAGAWWVGARSDRGGDGGGLEWIEREFSPRREAMEALREVHERFRAERREVARELERQRDELVRWAGMGDLRSDAFRRATEQWDRLSARSHAMSWRYLQEMSELLPPPDAERFRREFARMVLGDWPGSGGGKAGP